MTDNNDLDVHEHSSTLLRDSPRAGIDTELLNDVAAATVARCRACTNRLTRRLVSDDRTWARLMEWTFETTQSLLGCLPQAMTELDAPGHHDAPFRTLARSFLFLGRNRRYSEWAAMTATDRYAAAQAALTHLIDVTSEASS